MNASKMAVAIVGMCGAGKSEVAAPLRSANWAYVHFGGVTMDELARRGLEVNEKNERIVREELRAQGGMGAFAELLWPKVEEALADHNVVIDGLYSWSEYRILKEHLGDRLVVLAVVASRETRYARLAARPERPLTREEAEARDIAEIENLEKGGPIAMADVTLMNDGPVDQLYADVAAAVADIGARMSAG